MLKFTHLKEVPVAESSGPVEGKSQVFSKRGTIDVTKSAINMPNQGRVYVLDHLARLI